MTNHSPLRALRALSLAALVGGSATSASAPTVTLSRNQARPTSELTVTARGFSPGESVE